MPNRGETDIDGWALDVIETMIRAVDDDGRKVCLDHATRRKVLERAMAYSNQMQADMQPGGFFHSIMSGLATEAP
jgi:hypothetical protein